MHTPIEHTYGTNLRGTRREGKNLPVYVIVSGVSNLNPQNTNFITLTQYQQGHNTRAMEFQQLAEHWTRQLLFYTMSWGTVRFENPKIFFCAIWSGLVAEALLFQYPKKLLTVWFGKYGDWAKGKNCIAWLWYGRNAECQKSVAIVVETYTMQLL